MAFLDGSFAPAKKGGDQVGLTKKGKGTKWMLVIDGNGLPLGFHLESANTAEIRLAEATLDTIAVPRPRGRPRQRPEKLVADRVYDSSAFRAALRRRGMGMCIPPKRRPAKWRPKRGRPVVARSEDYRCRYKVERSFAWLGNFRRLLIRWEHCCDVYRGFFAVAVMLVCCVVWVERKKPGRGRTPDGERYPMRIRRGLPQLVSRAHRSDLIDLPSPDAGAL